MATHEQGSHEFDPQARFVDQSGLSYRNFAAYLVGKVDQEDRCNHAIRSLKHEQGRSDAFCREYRIGYEGGVGHAKAAGQEDFVQHAKGDWEGYVRAQNAETTARAHGAARRWLNERAARAGGIPAATEHTERSISAYARATALHGDYHES